MHKKLIRFRTCPLNDYKVSGQGLVVNALGLSLAGDFTQKMGNFYPKMGNFYPKYLTHKWVTFTQKMGNSYPKNG
jgi:hypothetical protein